MPPKANNRAKDKGPAASDSTTTIPMESQSASQVLEAPPTTIDGGPARRTRAATKSPQKLRQAPLSKLNPTRRRVATGSSQQPSAAVNPKVPRQRTYAKNKQVATQPAIVTEELAALPRQVNEVSRTPVQHQPDTPVIPAGNAQTSPYRVPFRIRRTVRIPRGMYGLSQPKSDETYAYDSDEGPSPGKRSQFAEDHYGTSSEDDDAGDEGNTKSYDDQDGSTRLVFPELTFNGGMDNAIDIEVYEGTEEPDGFIEMTPTAQHVETARSMVAQSSPLAARAARRSPRHGRPQPRPRLLPGHRKQTETQAHNADDNENQANDVLSLHQSKKRKKNPNTEGLAAVAERLRLATAATRAARIQVTTQVNQRSNAANQINQRPNAADPPFNFPGLQRRTDEAATSSRPNVAGIPPLYLSNAVAGPSNSQNRVVSSDALANAARQADIVPAEEFEDIGLTRKRKRTSNPAPHQIGSRTPNTRVVLRKGKDNYAFSIVTRNAYPTPQERVAAARESHDFAIRAAPDAAAIATGIVFSPNKVRIYGDTAWVRRSFVKQVASIQVPIFYRFGIPPALAETLPGGANPMNQSQYIKSRVMFLFDGGNWLRGRHGRHTSMLYAHPIFAEVLEQAVYRPANPEQRASLSPMPLPTLALVVTAVQCALQEHQSGSRSKISFTEEAYAGIYKSHLKRLNNMSRSHTELLGTLLESLYDYCVARNEAGHDEPQPESDVDELAVLNSDIEEADTFEYDVLDPFGS